MPDLHVPELLGLLAIMLATAKVFGKVAQLLGQPAVLGEMLAGVVLGGSVVGIVDQHNQIIHFLGELGVVILLFEIGLETDLRKLLGVGGAAAAVALSGVILPFACGYAVCMAWGLGNVVAMVVGASLTATSVGITARVLSDLGQLQKPEGQIILGAAVLDDVIGLVILTVVARMTTGAEITAGGVAITTTIAFAFLLVTLSIGNYVLSPIIRHTQRWDMPGTATIAALAIALGLAWLADVCGSAMIIGAFAAGLLLRRTPQAAEIEHGVANVGHFFVPLFFVVVGSAVDLHAISPFAAETRGDFSLGSVLVVAAIISKFAAGYAPFWFRGRKHLIGAGMIPRGEVGLIFAQMGLTTGTFSNGVFSAIAMMVMATTLVAPPLLKWLSPRRDDVGSANPAEGIEDLVN